jgi:superfamily II DNA or RNA helicase
MSDENQRRVWQHDVQLKLRAEASPIRLRDHQLAASDRLTAHFLNGKKKAGLVVVPPGSGKTLLAAHWLLSHHVAKGGRVLWLAHRRSLLRQAFSAFARIANVAHPHKDALNLIAISSTFAKWSNVSPEHEVIFSSMQTAVLEANAGFIAELHDGSPGGLFIVLDEAHHAPAPRSYELLKKMKGWGCPLLGLTATPVRADDEDEKRLSALFDNTVVYQATRRNLTERGILAAPSFETVKTNVNFEKDFTPEDYKHLERFGELGPNVLARLAKNASRNGLIVDHYLKKRGTYGPTIVFAADTLHAQTLAGEFQKKGVDADYVDYSRDDAQEVILKYQEKKKPDVLVNVEMLTEGFDAPHTRTVFIARPTRSEGLLTQMVGRALRGKESGGNDKAYLVTFLDTWEQFNVLDAEYVLSEPLDIATTATPGPSDVQRMPIPLELVREAYRLMQSNVRGQLVGVFQCLPHSWYAWEETFEDDLQRRTVMVFDNQDEPLAALLAAFPTAQSVPAEVSEEIARDLLRKHFADVPDPLPRWTDVQALLDGKRKGCSVHHYTFEEKNEFDPRSIASEMVDKNLALLAQQKYMQDIWDAKAACRSVYRDDQRAFIDDVTREMNNILSPPKPAAEPEVAKIVPTHAPKAWSDGERGYSLTALRDGVLSVKKHFPTGSPLLGDIRWSTRATSNLWGFCRYSDKSVTLNCVLNSPDVPLFVVEFLMFHEMLHADMPSAGHNRDFRARERSYAPSVEAREDATKRGIKPGPNAGPDFWRVRADMFLDTFERYYAHKKPGTRMDM